MSIFYTERYRNSYLINESSAIPIEDLATNNRNLVFPCEIDTEFQRKHALTDPTTRLQPTIVITNQLRAISESIGVIFAHQDIKSFARHPIFKSGFSPIDYLELLGERYGFKVENFTRHTGENAKSLHRTRNKKGDKIAALPVLEFSLYAFYAVAEISKIATGHFKKDLVGFCRAANNQPRIEQKRRLRTVGKPDKNGFSRDYVNLPWTVDIEGVTYRLRLYFMDASAVHGICKYKDFNEAVGIKLEFKEKIKEHEKAEMVKMYQERPDDFDNYSLGDVWTYPALKANTKLFKQGYEALGLNEFFTPPKPTIGATVRDLFQARIAKEFEIPNKRKQIEALLDKVCKPANANYLKLQTDSTLCLNAKVRGGRCRNNKPTHTKAEGLLVDIDISGCYGEGQRNQLMLFGNPVKIHYPMNTTGNNYQTLGQFIKKYESELIYGCWQAVVTTKPGEYLKHPQDFINSWIEPKNFRDIANLQTDTDEIDEEELGDWLEKEIGSTKIYNHEIINGLINHDTLDWLNHVCGKHQRKELLEKLIVRTALIYPASERVNKPEEFLEIINNWTEGNNVELTIDKGSSSTQTQTKECHAWLGVNMGDFIITQLLIERKKHGKKTPLNTLYKLCINTLYGDMVSPYFAISNVIVGNNITARARALAWYMEKAFNGWQSITDGCVFDINKICFPREKRQISGENVVNLYREKDIIGKKNLYLKSLTDKGEITVERWETILDKEGNPIMDDDKPVIVPILKVGNEIIKNAHEWIAEKAWQHLQIIFPNVAILHENTTDIKDNSRTGMFVFEVKECYVAGVFHGTANYLLKRGDGLYRLKMRSYESKKHHERYRLKKGELDRIIELEKIPPSEFFLVALIDNPNLIPRGKTFMKDGILKCAEFKERWQSKYSKTQLTPGDTIFKIGLLKELSLSQFTFQTREQCESWEREMESLKRKYGQSYEMFFLDNDGNLKYQEMIEAIDTAIAEGKTGLGFRKKLCNEHPELVCNETLKDELEKAYQMDDSSDFEDWEMPEMSDDEEEYRMMLFGDAETELDEELNLDFLDL